jgi:hypothetical protein
MKRSVCFLPAPNEATSRITSKCVSNTKVPSMARDGDAGPSSSTLDFMAKTQHTKTDTDQGPNAICTAQTSLLSMHRQKHAASANRQHNGTIKERRPSMPAHRIKSFIFLPIQHPWTPIRTYFAQDLVMQSQV